MSRLEAFLKDALESASPEARAGAWGELSQLLRAFVRASMSSRSRAIEESMDVVNSVVKSFIGEIQEGKLRFEGEEQLKGYLRRVVRHKLAD